MENDFESSDKCLRCAVASSDIDLFTKLLEGCGHLALISSEASSGVAVLHYAAESEKELLSLLRHLPLAVKILPDGEAEA